MAEQAQQRSKGSIIALAIALAVVLGGVLGALGGLLGISPAILWGVMFPTVFVLVRALIAGGSARSDDGPRPGTIRAILLEGTARWRRLVQVVAPVVGVLMATVGVSLLVRRGGADNDWACPAVLVGLVATVASLLLPITWDLTYKGHRIRFQNHPCLAERLFIDGVLADRGGIGLHMLLRGTIPGGDGAGDRIIVHSYAGLVGFSCRILAESPAGGGSATIST